MNITPSQLARVANCPRSETIAHTLETTEPAHLGSVAHRYLCNVLLYGRDQALEMEADDGYWLQGIDLTRLPAIHPEQYAPEVAFAWNPATGKARELGRNLTRAKARKMRLPGEMVGVADVVGVTEKAAIVHDYKTGWGWIEPASVHLQVLTYGLMAALAYGKDEAEVSILRARRDGFVWFDTYRVDFWRLQDHAAEVIKILANVEEVVLKAQKGEPLKPFHEGPWCNHCPARMRCPTKTYQLAALADPALAPDGLTQSSRWHNEIDFSDEQLPLVWERIGFAERMLERLKNEVKERAAKKPIPLGGGYVLGWKESTSTTLVASAARRIFAEAYGEQLGAVLARECIKTEESLPKENVKRGLRKHILPILPKGEAKITKVYEALEKRFHEAKALIPNHSEGVREYLVKKEKEKIASPLLPAASEEPGEEASSEQAA